MGRVSFYPLVGHGFPLALSATITWWRSRLFHYKALHCIGSVLDMWVTLHAAWLSAKSLERTRGESRGENPLQMPPTAGTNGETFFDLLVAKLNCRVLVWAPPVGVGGFLVVGCLPGLQS